MILCNASISIVRLLLLLVLSITDDYHIQQGGIFCDEESVKPWAGLGMLVIYQIRRSTQRGHQKAESHNQPCMDGRS